ncbi:hypothetical protein [Psychrobacillus vulpis]|uniref:SbsC C-terminal domain-containing protein n=1 Tax=Psychrobacillus vulpis TaxID=2325572 RepID=A0A544TV00_9BACI|nr:hypothetical protein [Psychrobacillus vulpis]TQR21269.1 hypothetical protein FG384_03420 [Psychrobacillus vulpis]
MRNKTIKIAVSSIIATSAFVAAAPSSQHGDAAANMEQLMTDAQNAGNILKWAISVEGSADGVTQPWKQFNDAKIAVANVEAALGEVGFSEKLKYEARLTDVKIQIQRAQGYLDAITASTKIHAKTNALSVAVYSNNLDKVETAYHEMTAEFRKQTILLDRVYGQSTRDRIRNAVKGPAEKLIRDLKNDVTVHMLAKGAASDVKKGNYAEASKKVYEAQAILRSNVLIWENVLQKRIDEVNVSLPFQIVSISHVNNTTLTLKLNRAISSIKASDFSFNNGLSVTNASLNKDGVTITLTTSVQTPGSYYTLKYKGNTVSFSVPGSIVPIYVGDMTIQHKETSEILALTAIFKESNGQPSKATIRVDIPAGLKLVSVNGAANNTAGARSVNVTPDRNGTVTIVFTAKDLNVSALDKIITFNKIEKSKVVETQSSGTINFYVAAKEGTISNKKVHFVDTYHNYFVTNDGVKYNMKATRDVYRNEGNLVSFDSFKAALDVEDVVQGTYHPTSTSSFNISSNMYVTPVNLDTKFSYKNGTTGYRMNGSNIVLFGTGEPNYEIFFYKNAGISLGKTKVKSNGTWTFTTDVEQRAINDFSIVQQTAGKAIPAYNGWGEKTLRVIEAPFEIESISEGASKDNDLSNEEIIFKIAPSKHKNGAILAQDQALVTKQASIIVIDSDGTKVRFTNNQSESYFQSVKNGFTIKFGSIDTNKRSGSLLDKGRDGKLSGTLAIESIEGVTNEYGMNLTLNKGNQITGY